MSNVIVLMPDVFHFADADEAVWVLADLARLFFNVLFNAVQTLEEKFSISMGRLAKTLWGRTQRPRA